MRAYVRHPPQPRSPGTSDRGSVRHAGAMRRRVGASLSGDIPPANKNCTVFHKKRQDKLRQHPVGLLA